MDRSGRRYGVGCASHAALQLSLNGSDSASTTRRTSQIRRDVFGGLRWSPRTILLCRNKNAQTHALVRDICCGRPARQLRRMDRHQPTNRLSWTPYIL